MEVSATAMARGLLMPMPTMAATAMVGTAMARGPLMLTMEAMAMAVSATATAVMPMASNFPSKATSNLHNPFVKKAVFQISVLDLNLLLGKLNCNYELTKLKYTQML